MAESEKNNNIELYTCLNKCICEIKDPRRVTKGNYLYPLREFFFLVISVVISGTEDWKGNSFIWQVKNRMVKAFLPYKNGTPSHDVLGNLFSRIDVENFNQFFMNWINSISKPTDGEVIAFDGKTIRGSGDSSISNSAIHIVSAYATEQKICIGQTAVNEKHNEITAIPEILELIAINGCAVTIDAMGCQKEIDKDIIRKNADYVLIG